ncbi:ubiquitin-protein ligase-like protein E3 [Eremomyces bilateralis CBS 781.70]|uniref:Ubiquitin-protein ligase-like protein E3 n=1 Tax=Eremomyces bilateralis CBS 781.70 TaxID=1392243 RepID=A0A6G1GEJ1_9PEZI|nr:ubiquitin-protein ligase-like protein E3 [Eremomyces bilateralis CBS 781.70]KAF1816444.1 ubiquitin-protein ligase-like protein E3 [Eremomyces bilateralis CBS 781.70]
METAIRWSPHATAQKPRFVLIDVAVNRIRLCEIQNIHKQTSQVRYRQVAQRDNLPNFTAFDWSKTHENLIALGSLSGEANLLRLDVDATEPEALRSFPIKSQRKCNSIAFSYRNLLATGLERVRSDFCLHIYDLNSEGPAGSQEPIRKLSGSEAITSVKFFAREPDLVAAGVSRSCIRIWDLRESATSATAQYPTRQVHNLAIDPLDDNYFVSAGPPGDPVVCVWDRRFASRAGPSTPSSSEPPGPLLEIRNAIDTSQHRPSIWSLRFCGVRPGCFGILSSAGEIKVIEIARFNAASGGRNSGYGSVEGSVTKPQYHASFTHNVTWPWYDMHRGQPENNHVMAYDFMSVGPTKNQSVIALRSSREVEMIEIPSAQPEVGLSNLDDLLVWKESRTLVPSNPSFGTVAEELLDMQVRKLGSEHTRKSASDQIGGEIAARIDKLHIDSSASTTANDASGSNWDLHEELLHIGFPKTKLDFSDIHTLLSVQRRRCQEGYLFDVKKNKSIVANDRWLVEMWDTVKRFEELAVDRGMIGNNLDLSFVGIAGIWKNSFGSSYVNRVLGSSSSAHDEFIDAVRAIVSAKELPEYEGVETAYPEHRQLCLAVCGWTFASVNRLRQKCLELIENGDHYKAIAMAVFRGRKTLALELLKQCIRQRRVDNIGLVAVIACDTVNEEQRSLCSWMADETSDPYLKALLSYFVIGDWKVVASMNKISLSERIGVAMNYLDDARLGEFISIEEQGVILFGNIEGIIFTGLTDRGVDLFQHYVAKFHDVQTAVLVMAHTIPRYLSDMRFDSWKSTYLNQMQAWQAYVPRTKFNILHTRKSIGPDGKPVMKPPPAPIRVRCTHCHAFLGVDAPTKTKETPTPAPNTRRNPAMNSGIMCQQCGKAMPRCGICMHYLGSPDPSRKGGVEALKGEELMSRQIVFCAKCKHGNHDGHAKLWFAKHQVCPVPDCQCMCGLLH